MYLKKLSESVNDGVIRKFDLCSQLNISSAKWIYCLGVNSLTNLAISEAIQLSPTRFSTLARCIIHENMHRDTPQCPEKISWILASHVAAFTAIQSNHWIYLSQPPLSRYEDISSTIVVSTWPWSSFLRIWKRSYSPALALRARPWRRWTRSQKGALPPLDFCFLPHHYHIPLILPSDLFLLCFCFWFFI